MLEVILALLIAATAFMAIAVLISILIFYTYWWFKARKLKKMWEDLTNEGRNGETEEGESESQGGDSEIPDEGTVEGRTDLPLLPIGSLRENSE